MNSPIKQKEGKKNYVDKQYKVNSTKEKPIKMWNKIIEKCDNEKENDNKANIKHEQTQPSQQN